MEKCRLTFHLPILKQIKLSWCDNFFFYLCDSKQVDSSFLFLQVVHVHWRTHQEHIRNGVFIHINGTQHTTKIGANLG